MKRLETYLLCSVLLLIAFFSATPMHAVAPVILTIGEYHAEDVISSRGGTVSAVMDKANNRWVVTAIPADSTWMFVRWDDGNTDNPRYFDEDDLEILSQTFTAQFAVWYYKNCFSEDEVTMDQSKAVNDTGQIVVTQTDGTYYFEAIPAEGFTFAQWGDGSYMNPRSLASVPAGEGVSLYATFIPDSTLGKIDSWTADTFVVTTTKADVALWQDFRRVSVFQNATSLFCQVPDREDLGVYNVDIENLKRFSGQTIHIVYKDLNNETGYFDPFATLDVVVPVIATRDTTIATVPSETTGIHVVRGVTQITGDMHVAALEIYPGAKAIVTGNVTADSIVMRRSDTISAYPPELVVQDGGTLTHASAGKIYFDYRLHNRQYFPFALPYTVNTSAIKYRSGHDAAEHFAIQSYSGKHRAEGVADSTWIYYYDPGSEEPEIKATGHQDIIAGVGYNIFAEPENWSGTYEAQDKYGAHLMIPMNADLSGGGEPNRYVSVSVHATTQKANRNWNLIGLPYLAGYTGLIYMADNSDTPLRDENNNPRTIHYLTEPLEGFQDYDHIDVSDGDAFLKPFQCYFIQFNEDVEDDIDRLLFYEPELGGGASAPRRRLAAKTPATNKLKVGITLAQNGKEDHTALYIAEQYTNNYDIDADLAKMIGSTSRVKLYSLLGSQKLAYMALPPANGTDLLETTIPLGYESAVAGQTMTFAIDTRRYPGLLGNENIYQVNLNDEVAGVSTNLLEQSYECTAILPADNNRFSLGVVYRAPGQGGATGCEEVRSTALPDGIYDLLGRPIRSNANALPAGVYIVVREGKAEKEVIR